MVRKTSKYLKNKFSITYFTNFAPLYILNFNCNAHGDHALFKFFSNDNSSISNMIDDRILTRLRANYFRDTKRDIELNLNMGENVISCIDSCICNI